jgi:hypothetical protein
LTNYYIYKDEKNVIILENEKRERILTDSNDDILNKWLSGFPEKSSVSIEGIYSPRIPILITKSITIEGNNKTEFFWENPKHLFQFSGKQIIPLTPISPITLGSTEIPFVSDNIQPGDLIEISDDTIWQLGNKGYYDTWKTGEIHEVYLKTDKITKIYDATVHTYDKNPTISVSRPITVSLSGLEFKGSDQNKNIHFIKFGFCANVAVSRCKFSNAGGHCGVYLFKTVDSAVKECIFKDAASVYNYYGTKEGGRGYGVVVGNSSANISIKDNTFKNLRHGVACGGNGGIGQPRDIRIKDNFFTGITAHPIDAHQITESIIVSGNVVHANGNYALVTGARHTIASLNKFYNTKKNGISTRGIVDNRIIIDQNNIVI